jgi:DNA-3-methyladenine glycosylase
MGGAEVSAEAADRSAVLPREFLDRPVLSVAPDLLGCVLEHQTAEGLVAVEIVEVEAYRGESDPASHAFRGRTPRNAVMYGEPGHAYVYFTYGMHFCVNLVCQPPGEPAAVLIRAGRVTEGVSLAASRRLAGPAGPAGSAGSAGSAGKRQAGPGRNRAIPERELARGPARLCQALGIGRAQNGADVCDPAGQLRVLGPADGAAVPADSVARGPRVGVSQGAEAHWRFWIAGDPAVSVYRPWIPRKRVRTAS